MDIEVDILRSNLRGPCLCLAPRGLTDPLKCEGTDATEAINQKYRKKSPSPRMLLSKIQNFETHGIDSNLHVQITRSESFN